MSPDHFCCLCKHKLPVIPDVVFNDVAVHNNLLPENESNSPFWKKNIDLYTCPHCALVQQAEIIPPEQLYADGVNYTGEWRFQPHLGAQIQILEQYVDKESAVEVGCNSGGFLHELQSRGWKRVCGIEANKTAVAKAKSQGIKVYNSIFDKKICCDIAREQGKFSLFVARHTLEHIADLSAFFQKVDQLLYDRGYIFIEVPNFEPKHTPLPWSFTFINHEHCTYFTEYSLSNCLSYFGYNIKFLEKNSMGGGVLNCLACKDKNRPAMVWNTKHIALDSNILKNFFKEIESATHQAKAKGLKILLYGAGCHGISFLNSAQLQSSIDWILDDVPEKHNLYVPGCKAKIVPPSYLKNLLEDCLILLAIHPEYEDLAIEKIKNFHLRGETIIHFLLSKHKTLHFKN